MINELFWVLAVYASGIVTGIIGTLAVVWIALKVRDYEWIDYEDTMP